MTLKQLQVKRLCNQMQTMQSKQDQVHFKQECLSLLGIKFLSDCSTQSLLNTRPKSRAFRNIKLRNTHFEKTATIAMFLVVFLFVHVSQVISLSQYSSLQVFLILCRPTKHQSKKNSAAASLGLKGQTFKYCICLTPHTLKHLFFQLVF